MNCSPEILEMMDFVDNEHLHFSMHVSHDMHLFGKCARRVCDYDVHNRVKLLGNEKPM